MAETGLNQNYNRDYDPQVGRYIESDPIGLHSGVNTYGYTEGNPIKFGDPTGLLFGSAAAWELALERAGLAEAAGLGPEDPVADVAAALAIIGTIATASDSDTSQCKPKCKQATPENIQSVLAQSTMQTLQLHLVLEHQLVADSTPIPRRTSCRVCSKRAFPGSDSTSRRLSFRATAMVLWRQWVEAPRIAARWIPSVFRG